MDGLGREWSTICDMDVRDDVAVALSFPSYSILVAPGPYFWDLTQEKIPCTVFAISPPLSPPSESLNGPRIALIGARHGRPRGMLITNPAEQRVEVVNLETHAIEAEAGCLMPALRPLKVCSSSAVAAVMCRLH